jgi:hypothetical protein
MSKKLIYLISVLALSLASITYGIPPIQLGNFENLSDPNHDEWIVADDVNVAVSYSTTGVTLGSHSLKITAEPNTQEAITYDLIKQGKVDAFRKNLKVSADVTRLVSEWTEIEGAYCDFTLTVQAGSSVAGKEWDLWWGTSGNSNWLTAKGDDPMHINYDYSLALNQIDFNNLEYLNFVFSTNWGVFNPGGIYYLDNVQMFGGGPAYEPHPSAGEIGVRRDIILSWTPGAYAKKHDVYFGTNFNDVNDANRVDPHGVLVKKDGDVNTYDPPGFLGAGTTYYWRIDEVNGPPDYTIYRGDVWSFTTLSPGIGVVIGDWEQNMDGWQKGPQGTVTFGYSNTKGVTLGNYSLTMNALGGFWTFQRPGWVDLTNMTLCLDVTMIASEWSGQWTKIDKLAVSSDLTPGWREFTPTAIDRLTGNKLTDLSWGSWNGDAYRTYMWDLSSYSDWANATTITINIAVQNAGTATGPFHFDNARLLDTRIASDPKPMDYATGVWIVPTLSWKAGKYAKTHDVYFGTDFDKVTDANNLWPVGTSEYKGNQAATTYKPGALEFDTIYYWRIDEANNTRAPYIWKGRVWTFMTGQYLIVDDFEDYTNTSPKRIGDPNGWIKGGGGTVGYPDPNYAEVTIVHEGAQSMPFDYNNLKSPNYSEATRTFATSQNWATYGIHSLKSLSLWLRGYPVSVGSFVESPPGTYTITASGTDIWNVPDLRRPSRFHDEFHYAYKEVTTADAGNLVTIIAKIESVSNTDPWAKASVMIRDSLDPNSTHGMMCASSLSGDAFQWRLETGGVTDTNDANAIGLPCWVKLVLDATPGRGNLRAYRSRTGAAGSWIQSGTVQQIPTMTLPRATPLYVGLAATAHNATATCTAKFSSVSIAAGTVGAWKHQDIGIKSNTVSPLYITLEDATSPTPKTATVTHDDPNIVLTTNWQEWLIPLARFTNVDLQNIKKITIGVGNRGAPQPIGKGTLYFDDIRLYKPMCISGRPGPAADFTGDCYVDYADLATLTNDWLKTPQNRAIDVNENGTIDLRDYAVLAGTWLEELLWPPPMQSVWAYQFKNDANCYDPGPPIPIARDLHLEFADVIYLVDTGPFISYTGNETKKITLYDGSVPAKGSIIIRVSSTGAPRTLIKWWWTDELGKRIGKEMPGVGLSCKLMN